MSQENKVTSFAGEHWKALLISGGVFISLNGMLIIFVLSVTVLGVGYEGNPCIQFT